MSETKHRILVVDDDKAICWVLEKAFTEEGYLVDVASNGKQALELIGERQYSLVTMDIRMPVMGGIETLEAIHRLPNRPETIVMTAHSNMENTIEAMKHGAFEYVVKPFDIDEVLGLAKHAIEKYESRRFSTGKAPEVTDRIIGDSPVMRDLYKKLGRIAPTDSTVLITGETGTGKDLFARAIHYYSPRRDGPFITVNCASIPGELLESELFGHVRGAFTGATVERKGKCALADGGTLFLDEIGTMRFDLQAKLLTFLQRSEFEPVGSSRTAHVNVRVITATNADIRKLTQTGAFREDLYYRLMVVPIHIPPLRERREDIPLLAKYFVERYNAKYNLDFKLTDDIVDDFMTRDLPGNVRELENAIHRMVVLQLTEVGAETNLAIAVPGQNDLESVNVIVAKLVESGEPDLLARAHERIEEPLLRRVMSHVGENQSEAARLLGISRNTLRKMLAQYHILQQ